MKFYLTTWKL